MRSGLKITPYTYAWTGQWDTCETPRRPKILAQRPACSPVGQCAVWQVVESPSALFSLIIQSIHQTSEIALVFRGKSGPFDQDFGWNKHGKFYTRID